MPSISVIVCCYNHEKWIERCIRSLLNQKGMDGSAYEIILINDCSTDNSSEVIENFSKISNIRIFNNLENIGLPACLNFAIRIASGRYIVRVDSDDYVSRNFLWLMEFFLDKNRNYQAVATDYVKVDQFESEIERVNCFENEIACGVMFRKECLFDIGLYDERYKMREGHNLRKRFEEKFSVGRLEFPLYKYRHHTTNRTLDQAEVEVYEKLLKGKK